MIRRKFLQYSGLTAGFMLGKVPVWASAKNHLSDLADENDNILIVVQMFGGNDGLNTIIPADDDRYYSKYRTSVNVQKSKAVKIKDGTYMNPLLKSGVNNGLYGLYNEGNLAVVQGVGYPSPNLSHFRSTDIWLSGVIPSNDAQRLETGWMGRYIEKLNNGTTPDSPPCMNIGSASSLLFQGANSNTAIAVENPNDFYERGKDILSGNATLTDKTVYANEYNYLLDLSVQSNKYSAVVKKAFDTGRNTVSYENDSLSKEMQLVARLISGGLKTKLYLVSIDGFDTHANQGSEDGKHASLLKAVSSSIASLMADLKEQKLSDKVVGMTVSEFGRRPEQNASSGTDHGAASVMFVFGNAVNGKVYGQNLSFDFLNTNKDFSYQFDYRRIYDELMMKWFKTDSNTTREILSGRYDVIEGGLFSTKTPLATLQEPTLQWANVYPNPTTDGFISLKISLQKPSIISAQITNIQGVVVNQTPQMSLPAGEHELPMRVGEVAGTYLVQVKAGDRQEVLKVLRV